MSDIEGSDIELNSLENGESVSNSREKAKQHAKQLQKLQEKDPEFYQYLKEYDKELLDFKDEDIDDDVGTDSETQIKESKTDTKTEQKSQAKPITTEMVDKWIKEIKEHGKLGAVRSMLRAFGAACHYGDDDSGNRLHVISSNVFNKVMVFVLSEMDEILRGLVGAPASGGKKETVMELTAGKPWKRHGGMVRVYLGNAYHILTQMTDEMMISYTLRRVKASAVFLAAFPSFLRKYVKVVLHTWGTGRGALPVVSFLFLRDLCIRLGSDCLETCLRGVYKAYIMNCKLSKSVSVSKLQQIQFLGNCVTELYGVDPPAAYQLAFLFIRQLATVLRGALTEKGPKVVKDKKKDKKQNESHKPTKKQVEKAYQKVYDWQYIFSLEMWTGVVCSYSSETEFRPLAYPLAQIIYGVACLVPTVRYFPLRLRCVRMLNRIAAATGTFVPVSSLLLDMLEMKELHGPPAGGVGKAVNLLTVKQVDKTTVKTRSFQEACIYGVVEELAEHLSQWSCSVAFYELSFIPLVQLRSFCKTIKADRFRKEIKELIRQVEANVEFTNLKRLTVGFSPNDPAVESFLQVEKEGRESPLSKLVTILRARAKQRRGAMSEKSVLVGAESSVFARELSEIREENDEDDEEEGDSVFNSSWLPEKKKSKDTDETEKKNKNKNKKRKLEEKEDTEGDEDVVEDLVLSSDDDGSDLETDDKQQTANLERSKKQKNSSKKKRKSKPRRNKKAKVDLE